MVLRMKNFNILGFHWKIQLLREFTKKQYRGVGLPKKGEAWTVCRFITGVLTKKKEVVFLREIDTPMRTMRVVQNLERNLFFVSKMTRIWWILIWALKSLKNLHFDWSLLCKVYNVWPKKSTKEHISWHWRVMQNSKKNWLVVWKITWEI